MKTIEKIAKGLAIMVKYKGAEVAAEPEKILAGPYKPADVMDIDKRELESLGWHFDAFLDCWTHTV